MIFGRRNYTANSPIRHARCMKRFSVRFDTDLSSNLLAI
jgi:hypothetical protein